MGCGGRSADRIRMRVIKTGGAARKRRRACVVVLQRLAFFRTAVGAKGARPRVWVVALQRLVIFFVLDRHEADGGACAEERRQRPEEHLVRQTIHAFRRLETMTIMLRRRCRVEAANTESCIARRLAPRQEVARRGAQGPWLRYKHYCQHAIECLCLFCMYTVCHI